MLSWLIIYTGLLLPTIFEHFTRRTDERIHIARLSMVIGVVAAIPLVIHYDIGLLGGTPASISVFLGDAIIVFLIAVIIGLTGPILYRVIDPANPPDRTEHPW